MNERQQNIDIAPIDINLTFQYIYIHDVLGWAVEFGQLHTIVYDGNGTLGSSNGMVNGFNDV